MLSEDAAKLDAVNGLARTTAAPNRAKPNAGRRQSFLLRGRGESFGAQVCLPALGQRRERNHVPLGARQGNRYCLGCSAQSQSGCGPARSRYSGEFLGDVKATSREAAESEAARLFSLSDFHRRRLLRERV